MEPTVRLISWTRDPILTIFQLWKASRSDAPVNELDERPCGQDDDPGQVFLDVIRMGMPVAEAVSFVFLLGDVSVAFREQMVRHRIGIKIGDRIGMDYFPDIHDSSWWSQSMRILNMKEFYKERRFHIPKSIEDDPLAVASFRNAMEAAALRYKDLCDYGIPMEDAREVIPLAATHTISWTLNLVALQHIIRKRACWLPQTTLWGPIIMQMVDELEHKVSPTLRQALVRPPCIDGKGCYTKCIFAHENERRADHRDKLPPCPLHVLLETKKSYSSWYRGADTVLAKQSVRMIQAFKGFLGADQWTEIEEANESTQLRDFNLGTFFA